MFEKEGTKVKIICGEWENNKGPIKYETPSIYMDVTLPKENKFVLPIKGHWNSIIFVHEGKVVYHGGKQEQVVNKDHCCVLEKNKEGDVLHTIIATENAKFILISG